VETLRNWIDGHALLLQGLILGALALIVIGFGLTVVGYSDRQARSEISATMTKFFTVGDPAECTENVTPALLHQNFPGPDPLESCRRVNSEGTGVHTESIDVDRVDLHATSATASITLSGGGLDGSEVTVDLLNVSDRWKINHLALAHLDRARFDREMRSQAIKEGVTSREADCMVADMHRAVSDQEMVRTAFDASSYGTVGNVGVNCLSRATLMRQFNEGLTRELQGQVPTPVADCISYRFTSGMSDTEFRAFIRSGEGNARQAARLRVVAESCARDYASGVLPKSGTS
jgi:hypothetical protein